VNKVPVYVCYGCLLRLNIFESKIISCELSVSDTSQTLASTSQLIVLCVSADSEKYKQALGNFTSFYSFRQIQTASHPLRPAHLWLQYLDKKLRCV
jgi:hypothetical protein